MSTLDDLLLAALATKGFEVKVTDALPFMARNLDGENIGLVHWFPMFGCIWVSQEFYDKLKSECGDPSPGAHT